MSSSPWKCDDNSPLTETDIPSKKQIMIEALDVQMQMTKALEGRNALVGAKAIAFLIGYIACSALSSEDDCINFADYIPKMQPILLRHGSMALVRNLMHPKTNKRVRKAYDVLNRGGYWRITLERTFTGDCYVTRLCNRFGTVVKGAGPKTFYELRDMDLLVPRVRTVPANFALDETMFLDWMTIQGITHPDQILTMHCDMNAVKRGLNCNFAEEWTLRGATS